MCIHLDFEKYLASNLGDLGFVVTGHNDHYDLFAVFPKRVVLVEVKLIHYFQMTDGVWNRLNWFRCKDQMDWLDGQRKQMRLDGKVCEVYYAFGMLFPNDTVTLSFFPIDDILELTSRKQCPRTSSLLKMESMNILSFRDHLVKQNLPLMDRGMPTRNIVACIHVDDISKHTRMVKRYGERGRGQVDDKGTGIPEREYQGDGGQA